MHWIYNIMNKTDKIYVQVARIPPDWLIYWLYAFSIDFLVQHLQHTGCPASASVSHMQTTLWHLLMNCPVPVRLNEAHADTNPIKIEDCPYSRARSCWKTQRQKHGHLQLTRIVNIWCRSSHAWVLFGRLQKLMGSCKIASFASTFTEH